MAQSASGAGDFILFMDAADLVDLHAIDPDSRTGADDAFTFVDGAPPVGPVTGVLYLTDSTPLSQIVQADTDGDGAYDFEITFVLSERPTAASFVL